MNTPAWQHWSQMPQVRLWEAVALSCNFDPKMDGGFRNLNQIRKWPTQSSRLAQKFADRLEITMAHVESDSLAVLARPGGLPWWPVSLPRFAMWASSVTWRVPAKFSKLADAAPIQEAFAFDPDSDTYPEELDIAFQVWRALSRNSNSSRSAKDQIMEWLKKHYSTLSGASVERIATVCNWDKKGGRPPQK